MTGALVSAAAACAAAARDAGDREHPGRGDGGQLRPSHAFPGGRTRIPDDESRIVQSHPRLDTVEERRLASEREAAASGVGSGSGRSAGRSGRGGAARRAAGAPVTARCITRRDPGTRLGEGERVGGGSPEGPGAPATVRVRAETVSRNGSKPSSWESNGSTAATTRTTSSRGRREAPPLGGVGGVGGRGRRGRAARSRHGRYDRHDRNHAQAPLRRPRRPPRRVSQRRGSRARARGVGALPPPPAFKGEVFDAIKKPISEKDVVDDICRRADEESAKTYFIGSRTPSLELRLLMFAVALALACVPLHRGVHGAEISAAPSGSPPASTRSCRSPS